MWINALDLGVTEEIVGRSDIKRRGRPASMIGLIEVANGRMRIPLKTMRSLGTMGRTMSMAGAAALVLAGLLTTPAGAQDNALGEQLFAENCAVCHGTDAKGGGEFGRYLTLVPPDLTTLSLANDGVFPFLEVMRIIDGRAPVPGHGAGDMPIWGNTFTEQARAILEEAADRAFLVRVRILALADYLETLQED